MEFPSFGILEQVCPSHQTLEILSVEQQSTALLWFKALVVVGDYVHTVLVGYAGIYQMIVEVYAVYR
jgi:hypothetical protein